MVWEVDWGNPGNTGERVWARNANSHWKSAREWHWTFTGHLRAVGVQTPEFNARNWEMDWTKRQGKKVWARNPSSKVPSAREWHWIHQAATNRIGVKWQRKRPSLNGRFVNKTGYVVLLRTFLSDADIALGDRHSLFLGAEKKFLLEHRLVAVKKYGAIPHGTVVRHINGVKTDNRPDNLVLGTTQENTRDHDTARVMAMYWRERSEYAERLLMQLCAVAAIQTRLPL